MMATTDPSKMPDLLAKAETLVEALPYLQRYAGETFVIKYGGHAMGDPEAQRDFAEFSGRLDEHLHRLEALGVSYRPESGPLPHQQGGTGRLKRTPSPW